MHDICTNSCSRNLLTLDIIVGCTNPSINYLNNNRVISLPNVEPSWRLHRSPSTRLLETIKPHTYNAYNTYAGRLDKGLTIQSLPDKVGGSTNIPSVDAATF